ncbi:MAG TPA: hypothetical protein VK743_04155 [Steroidobacteraceae bacterium]|jgi:hypothetical protein|nr:hypothetical protein [Steroidobacteraceae bacterium]
MKPPKGVTDEAKWIRHCCQIHARAKELREGKINLIEASVALGPLASWTRAESERDFEVFRQLRDELIGLPIGRERKWWAAHALAREDEKIQTIEDKWRSKAMKAAGNLEAKYAWSLAARAALRKQARKAPEKRRKRPSD